MWIRYIGPGEETYFNANRIKFIRHEEKEKATAIYLDYITLYVRETPGFITSSLYKNKTVVVHSVDG